MKRKEKFSEKRYELWLLISRQPTFKIIFHVMKFSRNVAGDLTYDGKYFWNATECGSGTISFEI